MNPLQQQLAALRRRLRLVVSFRGAAWALAVLLLVAVAGGLLDWRLHLPSLVRAILLTGALTAAGYVTLRYWIRPLWARADDLSLALQVEARYPILNDALASAVQFLEQPPEAADHDSPSLRRMAVHRAMLQSQGVDFRPVIDTRGIRVAGLSFAVAGLAAVLLVLSYPLQAWTAFQRLANPFGGVDWPRLTQLEVSAKTRAARGEAFEIHGVLTGVVPERAQIEYRFEGAPPLRETYELVRQRDQTRGELLARLEPGRVQQNFRFQVQANDATSRWFEVEVLPPPQLVMLDGRPSPQIHLQYPEYTDLPPQDLPDGTSSIEAIAGTHITLHAATDRPVVRAWLECSLELEPTMTVAAGLNPLPLPPLWRQIPATISADGRVLSLDWLARVSGSFLLRFEDELGLGNSRLIELHTLPDPAPVVTLERPSRSLDSLEVLPDATLTLQLQVEDSIFAIRSVYLEYQTRKGDSPSTGGQVSRLALYDHEVLGHVLPPLLSGLGVGPMRPAIPSQRLRPQRLEIGRRWSLADLRLNEGDVLTIQACADDFDDVTVGKKPGRSHEVEIRIVGRTALDINVNQLQAQVQQELVRLQKLQQEALEKVIPAEVEWRNKGQLQPRQVDELIQAEQLQQQIRARVGTKQEGLQAEVSRVLQTLRDNHLPQSGTQDRMEAVATELERLAREELEQIEPRLTEARKENDAGPDRRAPAEKNKAPLPQARKHQDEVKKTLNDLLKLLEPWSSTREVKGEARSILQDQRRLGEQTENLAKNLPAGESADKLDPAQRAELQKAEELQKNLAERADQLLDKLERLADDKQKQDPETAQQLRAAARKGRDEKSNAVGKMRDAANSLRDNRLAEASNQQRDSSRAMEEVVKTLESSASRNWIASSRR
jgi:hypothetical protein